jgi:hypothetical protein
MLKFGRIDELLRYSLYKSLNRQFNLLKKLNFAACFIRCSNNGINFFDISKLLKITDKQ